MAQPAKEGKGNVDLPVPKEHTNSLGSRSDGHKVIV